MPHTVADGSTARIVIYGWTQILAGKTPPPLPPRIPGKNKEAGETYIDAMATVAEGHNGEEAAIAPYRIRGFVLFLFIVTVVIDLILNRREKKRLIHVPKAFVQSLHTKASQGLPEGEWVSQSDAVAAWLVKTAFPHSRFPRGVTFMQIIDLRGRHKRIPLTSLGNPMLRSPSWIDTSLGDAVLQEGARAIRRAVQLHASKDELGRQAALRVAYGDYAFNFYRINKSQFFSGDNGTSIKGQEMDWSGASYNDNSAMKSSAEVSPKWMWGIININRLPERNTSYMTRDREGAYWIQLNLREKDWIAMETDLADQAVIVG